MKHKNNASIKDRLRMMSMIIVCLLVISTGAMFAVLTFRKGDISGGILGIAIAIIILAFAIFTFIRGNREIREGYPLHDERSRMVIEKASSKAFYVSLYIFLVIGYLSEDVIKFRDVSQATGVGIGGMTLLFLLFWAYYNRKEI